MILFCFKINKSFLGNNHPIHIFKKHHLFLKKYGIIEDNKKKTDVTIVFPYRKKVNGFIYYGKLLSD